MLDAQSKKTVEIITLMVGMKWRKSALIRFNQNLAGINLFQHQFFVTGRLWIGGVFQNCIFGPKNINFRPSLSASQSTDFALTLCDSDV
jgi:hypothetical protein